MCVRTEQTKADEFAAEKKRQKYEKFGVCLTFVIYFVYKNGLFVFFFILFCCRNFCPIDYLHHLPPNFQIGSNQLGYTNMTDFLVIAK